MSRQLAVAESRLPLLRQPVSPGCEHSPGLFEGSKASTVSHGVHSTNTHRVPTVCWVHGYYKGSKASVLIAFTTQRRTKAESFFLMSPHCPSPKLGPCGRTQIRGPSWIASCLSTHSAEWEDEVSCHTKWVAEWGQPAFGDLLAHEVAVALLVVACC